MDVRTDGLLRGPRGDRESAMSDLAAEEWGLDTLLGLHLGLLDHAEDVRLSALDALMAIAQRGPDAVVVSPLDMLTRFMFDTTVTSGYRQRVFEFLARLGTPEAEAAVRGVLGEAQRNEDFESFLRILLRLGKKGLIQEAEGYKLSKVKAQILRRVLAEMTGSTSGGPA